MTCTGEFYKKPVIQIGVYSRYPKLGIFFGKLVGSVFIRLNFLNPKIPCRLLDSTPPLQVLRNNFDLLNFLLMVTNSWIFVPSHFY